MIESKFNINNVILAFGQKVEELIPKEIMALQELGDGIVTDARNSGNYKDQTGNLRSSVGFVVTVEKSLNTENFNITGNGGIGVQIGKSVATELALNGEDITLAVVAGMNYGGAVESKGYNVLSQAIKDKNYVDSFLSKRLL